MLRANQTHLIGAQHTVIEGWRRGRRISFNKNITFNTYSFGFGFFSPPSNLFEFSIYVRCHLSHFMQSLDAIQAFLKIDFEKVENDSKFNMFLNKYAYVYLSLSCGVVWYGVVCVCVSFYSFKR